MKKYNCLVICGPTATGKTTLAVELAKLLHGEIISADSRQVYRGMTIGTGKDLCEYGDVPYHLIDIVDPSTIYTLYNFQQDFYSAFGQVTQNQKLPILVGGSGLYIESVLKGYQIPEIPENVELRSRLQLREKDDLEKELFLLDPEIYKKTDRSSKKRVIRAIEIASFNQKGVLEPTHMKVPEIVPLVLCTRWPRAVLHQRIDTRLKERMCAGLIDEVQKLLLSGISRERYNLFGLEYKFAAQYLDSKIDKESMIQLLQTAIHQFAKRQETWFRGMERRGTAVHWIENAELKSGLNLIHDLAPDFFRYSVTIGKSADAHSSVNASS